MNRPKLSALNLAPMRQGQTAKDAIDAMVRLAQYVENLDFERFWIAEHHNMPHLVSSATQILIGHTLAHTQKIRVGSGGVMLPNHSPLQVAEQYGTLHTLYGNRVDLGVGRAPGTDPITALALRRGQRDVSHEFENDILALQRYFGDESVQGQVCAYPALGLNVPLYVLGSSIESAFLAGQLGLPYAFAAHFAPRMLDMAVAIYRQEFQPSAVLDKPYVIVCVNATVAESDEEAQFLHTTVQKMFLNLVRGTPSPIEPPVANMAWSPHEKQSAMSMLAAAIVGDVASAKTQFLDLQSHVHADEIMLTNYIFDEAKQLNAYKLFKEMIETV